MNPELDIRGGALRRDMARRMCMLGFDELRVVHKVMMRLELGRERYGNLDVSKAREWRRELREELFDALVYDLAEELAREDAERDPLRAEVERLRAELVSIPPERRAGSPTAQLRDECRAATIAVRNKE